MATRYQPVDAMLICRGDGVEARGRLEGDIILVVHAGSTAVGSRFTEVNERKMKQGVVALDGGVFRFLMDYAFPSPTAASDFVLGGRATNGWTQWGTAEGQTARELMVLAGLEELTSR